MTTIIANRGPMLHPRISVLVRRNGAVQLGWHPESAVIVRPPGPVEAVPALVRLLDGSRTEAEILWQARELGFDTAVTRELLDRMADADLLAGAQPRARLRTVRIHGRGPLADALLTGVRRIGLRAKYSHGRYREDRTDGPAAERPDLVILADALVPDPGLVAELMRRRIPHLPVRIREGYGMVGPLVLPGETGCLRCADLHRTDYEPDWPHLSAQLLGRVGYASPAGVAMTAALALKEIETVRFGRAARPPASLNATLEFDLEVPHLDRRAWPAHPSCGCGESV
ncbi:TOMM precursor leader peptide-binding protein [Nocardia sp. CDC160]|uniref:TOMM precursor leader peptide-binding protein n=1 Tax=Nocardia sp. CDC160 TaxID=3112166 RepID=UPI002DBBC2E7|nr:TOMM precursor leader peptide-binding protein [Nocardia sp. CDC160]MEC3916436.1 TOMM precursor leader peptide-binding protein [Nocardia sp. CDC160]